MQKDQEAGNVLLLQESALPLLWKAGWHPYTKRTCCCWASPVHGSGANSDAGGCCWVWTALDTSLALCDHLLLLCCCKQLRTSCCALRCWLRHNTSLCMLGSGEQNVRDGCLQLIDLCGDPH